MTNLDGIEECVKLSLTELISKIKSPKEESIQEMNTDFSLEKILNIFKKELCIRPFSQAIKDSLSKRVKSSIEEGRPIRLVVPFGCYKPSYISSTGLANWAEYFYFLHIILFAQKLCTLHSPGVEIAYKLGDIDMSKLAEVDEKSVGDYYHSFVEMVDYFSDKVDSKIKLTVIALSTVVNKKEFRKSVDEYLHSISYAWNGEEGELTRKSTSERTKRNLPNRVTSEDEQNEIALLSDAMVLADLNFLAEEDAINCIFRKLDPLMKDYGGGKTYLPVRSCKSTTVQFWVGEGGFVWNGKKLYPAILGNNSINNLKKITTIINPIPSLLTLGDSFSKITVYMNEQ